MSRTLSQSQEDYLEAILVLAKDDTNVCVRDIAKRLDVAMPSVTGAMRRLESLGFVRHGRYDYVKLTEAGRRRAREVAGRHALIQRFLIDILGVDTAAADKDACAIEHHASEETIRSLTRFMQRSKGRYSAWIKRGIG
jgi:DtxR family Mn-dependent transcriptional regulator